ncbi:NnrU family protein, partial [Nitrospirota bacterium]
MALYQSIGYVVLIFACFALIHSLLVTVSFKDACKKILGENFMHVHYRILYSIISIITFAIALYLIKQSPDVQIYKAPTW